MENIDKFLRTNENILKKVDEEIKNAEENLTTPKIKKLVDA